MAVETLFRFTESELEAIGRGTARIVEERLDLLDTIANLLRKSGRRRKTFETVVGEAVSIHPGDWYCPRCGWYGDFGEPAFKMSWDQSAYCPDCGGEL